MNKLSSDNDHARLRLRSCVIIVVISKPGRYVSQITVSYLCLLINGLPMANGITIAEGRKESGGIEFFYL